MADVSGHCHAGPNCALGKAMLEPANFSAYGDQIQPLSMDSSEPPFQETYKTFLESCTSYENDDVIVEECELPVVDLRRLSGGEEEREECEREIAMASREWGFFQVVSHGISSEVLEKMRADQARVFRRPFREKSDDWKMKLAAGSYRWGTPSATSLRQLSWSEAFHVPLSNMSGYSSLSSAMEEFARKVSKLAQKLAEILAEKMGHRSTFFRENCLPSTCYLRMNRYPPCPIPADLFGLIAHTDSDFLTILHQDDIGGLQLVKDGKWIAVKPNKEALIINIGDLFQAWSNGVYRSVEHRVVVNKTAERFSTAYFFCPSYETVIESCIEPSVYKRFSFGQFRQQVQEDVRKFGYKIGLSRFVV